MPKLDNFLSHIKEHGLSSTNNFEVDITLPAKMSVDGNRGLNMMCEASHMPGFGITTNEVRHNNSVRKVPYGVVHDDITFTFNISTDLYEKKIIDEWFDNIYDKETHKFKFYDDYTSDIFLHQLNKNGEKIHTVHLIEAYPITSSQLHWSNSEVNQKHKLEVQFAYFKWFNVDADGTSLQLNSLADIFDNPSPENVIAYASSSNVLSKVGDALSGDDVDFSSEGKIIKDKIKDVVTDYTGIKKHDMEGVVDAIENAVLKNSKLGGTERAVLQEVTRRVKDAILK